MQELTIVTGFWNIRTDRSETVYLDNFKNILKLSQNMVIFVPNVYCNFVIEHRKGVAANTKVVILELHDIKNIYFIKYWDRLQSIRTNEEWYNSVEWLKRTPQYFSEWYNPIVMSKVFLMDTVCKNNFFNSDKFLWLDAGMTRHISKDLVSDSIIDKVSNYINTVFFTSIEYTSEEMHGFNLEGFKKYTDITSNFLCRATIFGCDIKSMNKFVQDYMYYLDDTLERGYLGTEESIFTLLSTLDSKFYQRYDMGNVSMPDKFLKDINNKII